MMTSRYRFASAYRYKNFCSAATGSVFMYEKTGFGFDFALPFDDGAWWISYWPIKNTAQFMIQSGVLRWSFGACLLPATYEYPFWLANGRTVYSTFLSCSRNLNIAITCKHNDDAELWGPWTALLSETLSDSYKTLDISKFLRYYEVHQFPYRPRPTSWQGRIEVQI